jgi:hypothetical protein
VVRAFQDSGVALQAETLLAQQVAHRVRSHTVALPGQLCGQVPGRLGSRPQRRHRIAPQVGLDQGEQGRTHARINVSGTFAPSSGPSNTPQQGYATVQFGRAPRDRALAHTCGSHNRPDPAMPKRAGLGAKHQPLLALVQVREHRPELCRKHLLGALWYAHMTSTNRQSKGIGLFFCASQIKELAVADREVGAGGLRLRSVGARCIDP